MVVAVEGVVPRGQQPQVAPAAFSCVGAEPIGACLRDHDEVDPLGEVKSSTLEPVDDRCARRARLLDERQLGCLAPWGTRSLVFRPAREHHVVDDQRVLARCEQLREPHLAAIGRGLEDVVLPDEAARWECPALRGDLLVPPPELCLRVQQLVACAPVFARLAGEVDVRGEEYFPPLVHVAWFALESHGFHPFHSLHCVVTRPPACQSPGPSGPLTRAACSRLVPGAITRPRKRTTGPLCGSATHGTPARAGPTSSRAGWVAM